MRERELEQLPVIEIHRCYLYDCDHCGCENMIRVINAGGGAWIPKAVECYNCGTTFRTPDNSTEDEEGMDDSFNSLASEDDSEGDGNWPSFDLPSFPTENFDFRNGL